jgi:UDP-N-acetyl-D-glucosamine dehydrogenase
MSDALARLIGAVESRDARIAIIGPNSYRLSRGTEILAARFVAFGFDPTSPQTGLPPPVQVPESEIISGTPALETTVLAARLNDASVLLVGAPAQLNSTHSPDLSLVQQTVQILARVLRPGQLVVVECSAYPGMVREIVVLPLQKRGLALGSDWSCACCLRPNGGSLVKSMPRILGAVESAGLDAAATFYAQLATEVRCATSLEAAETASMLTGTLKAVLNAALHEVRQLCCDIGIDFTEVVALARNSPIISDYSEPSLAPQPAEPRLLSWLANKYGLTARLLAGAGIINESLPDYVLERISEVLNSRGLPLKGRQFLILGEHLGDECNMNRESPSEALVNRLRDKGAEVRFIASGAFNLQNAPEADWLARTAVLTTELVAAQDAVVIISASFALDWQWVANHAQLVIDAADVTRDVRDRRDRIVKV